MDTSNSTVVIANANAADNNDNSTEKVTKNTFESKIKKLEKKISAVEEKIAKLEQMKKEYKSEISHIIDEEILFLVKKSKMSMQEISDSLEIGSYIQKSGLSNSDVRELIGDDNAKI